MNILKLTGVSNKVKQYFDMGIILINKIKLYFLLNLFEAFDVFGQKKKESTLDVMTRNIDVYIADFSIIISTDLFYDVIVIIH